MKASSAPRAGVGGLSLRGTWVPHPTRFRSRGEGNQDASLQARLQKRQHEDFSETIVPRPTGADVILFPAIDLKDGLCVRLEQGDRARATIFHRDPAAQARAFEVQGFEYLHVVDLDGAFAGRPMNAGAVDRILEAVGIPVQLGGGIRDLATIEAWLGKGMTRVIVGTAAVRDPGLVREASRRFPGRVAVGLDARDGKIAVDGGAETSQLSALDVARRFEDAGVAAIIFTEIARDGLLQGLNLDSTIALAEAVKIPVVASGGLASLDDVRALTEPRANKLAGAIVGRALYDRRLDPAAALALIRAGRTAEACFMPLTVGGGVRSIEDIRKLLASGADKVSINTAAVEDRGFVKEAAEKFGDQCIVVAIDAKMVSKPGQPEKCEIFTHGGRNPTGLDALAYAEEVVALGAGEILLTSMDRAGTRRGFDIALTRAVADRVGVPVIASGGGGTLG